MTIYFADSSMNIYAMGSTSQRKGLIVYDDLLTEDLETGTSSFEARISGMSYEVFLKIYGERTYILKNDNGEQGVYTVLDADWEDEIVKIYAEDAGLDLLNDIATPFTADAAHDIAWYVNKYISDTGFEIGVNTAPTETLKLSFADEQTRKARIDEIAVDFGAEVSYGFEIEELSVKHMYIHLYAQRGGDNGVKLRVGKEIGKLRIITSAANIATGLVAVGGTVENSDIPVNLSGYSYDDGDFYISGNCLYSREALIRWARYAPEARKRSDDDITSHIIQKYNSSAITQAALCSDTVAELKKRCMPDVTYEAEVLYLPDGTGIGDAVYVVDLKKELFVKTRIIKVEKSCANRTFVATLGDRSKERQ